MIATQVKRLITFFIETRRDKDKSTNFTNLQAAIRGSRPSRPVNSRTKQVMMMRGYGKAARARYKFLSERSHKISHFGAVDELIFTISTISGTSNKFRCSSVQIVQSEKMNP